MKPSSYDYYCELRFRGHIIRRTKGAHRTKGKHVIFYAVEIFGVYVVIRRTHPNTI